MRVFGLADSQPQAELSAITRRREELSVLTDHQLQSAAKSIRGNPDVVAVFALSAVIAERGLRMRMFDVQILGALALQRGHIAEMQPGEGKPLAAVPAVIWYALQGRGVHVLTANDYLASRDAKWMGDVYGWFGLSVGHISQGMATEGRGAPCSGGGAFSPGEGGGFGFFGGGPFPSP